MTLTGPWEWGNSVCAHNHYIGYCRKSSTMLILLLYLLFSVDKKLFFFYLLHTRNLLKLSLWFPFYIHTKGRVENWAYLRDEKTHRQIRLNILFCMTFVLTWPGSTPAGTAGLISCARLKQKIPNWYCYIWLYIWFISMKNDYCNARLYTAFASF